MKILVTGGTGFTGAALANFLAEQGHTVTVLDTKAGLSDDELRRKGVQIVYGSVTDLPVVRQCVKDQEVVQHLAAAFRKVSLPKRVYREVNVEGTRRLCQEAQKAGVRRVVICSTQGVHGDVKEIPGNEDSPIAPEDFYQVTKYEAEEVARSYGAKGLEISILRPTAIYGPGDPGRFLMIFRMVQKGRFLMFGDGSACYHPVYIDNLCAGFARAGEADAPLGTYLIADRDYVTIADLVKRTAAAMGTAVKIVQLPFWPLYAASTACEALCMPLRIEPPLFRRRADWYRQNRAFRIDRAVRELGYDPAIGLDEGLRRTGDWYRANAYL
ncbi:MAG: NAD-dependent epimerase/dehydratase family protein [Candidatus Schekmanbacteria bacterium]|nr:NAD-dependent epimerase/dehydratase family protein [Candidatus Schekmanbacteria bacterium]